MEGLQNPADNAMRGRVRDCHGQTCDLEPRGAIAVRAADLNKPTQHRGMTLMHCA